MSIRNRMDRENLEHAGNETSCSSEGKLNHKNCGKTNSTDSHCIKISQIYTSTTCSLANVEPDLKLSLCLSFSLCMCVLVYMCVYKLWARKWLIRIEEHILTGVGNRESNQIHIILLLFAWKEKHQSFPLNICSCRIKLILKMGLLSLSLVLRETLRSYLIYFK